MRRIALFSLSLWVMLITPAAVFAQDASRSVSADLLAVTSIALSLLALVASGVILLITLFGYIRLNRQLKDQSKLIDQLRRGYDNIWQQFQKHVESPETQKLPSVIDGLTTQMAEINKRIDQQRQETSDTILAMTLMPLGEDQYRAKDLNAAIETYKRALSLNNNSPVIHYRLGYIYAQQGALNDAEACLQRALEIDPAYCSAIATMGYVYRRKGEMLPPGSDRETYLLKAEGKLLEALDRAPKSLDEEGESWWCTLGALYRQRGQLNKAIDAYKEAAKITPYSPYPLSNLALYQGMNGDVDAMIKTYREVERLARQKVQISPDDYWPYADLLLSRLAVGKIQEAEETLKILLKIVPRDLAYAVPSLLVALSRLSKILPDSASQIDEAITYIREHVVEGKGLDDDVSLSNESFIVPFDGDGVPAMGVRVSNHDDPAKVTVTLDLIEPRPAIFILGGAMDMASDEMKVTGPIIEEGLARFAQENGIAIVDGGTNSGVMKLMGEARHKNGASFPLIGVAPINLVKYKGYDNPNGYDLDPGHSHFVLTSEGDWGDETDMIVQLAYALTGSGQCPGLGLVINGGNIVRQEVYRLTVTERLKFPMLVLEGSGRFADTLAKAIRTGETDDDELKAIIDKDKIELLSVDLGPQGVARKLASYLKPNVENV